MKAPAPALFATLPVGRALFLPGDVGLSFNLISEGWRRYQDCRVILRFVHFHLLGRKCSPNVWVTFRPVRFGVKAKPRACGSDGPG